MNVLVISGNVGFVEYKDINGQGLLSFSLAVKKNFSKEKESQWIKCNLWGTRATSLQQYIVKGAGLVVTGEYQGNYNDEKKQSFPQVNVSDVDIMKFVDNDNQQTNQQPENQGGFAALPDDLDVPFDY